jgi:hypothetical protein
MLLALILSVGIGGDKIKTNPGRSFPLEKRGACLLLPDAGAAAWIVPLQPGRVY